MYSLRVTRQVFKVLLKLPFLVSPCKVGIRHVKPQLGKPVHDFRSCKCFREKYELRSLLFYIVYKPFPEYKGFCVWIVDSEECKAFICPEKDNIPDFCPQLLPFGIEEIVRIDIFVFFWRVLSTLYSTILFIAEPFRVLFYVRVIRAAVEGDIERGLKPCFLQAFTNSSNSSIVPISGSTA